MNLLINMLTCDLFFCWNSESCLQHSKIKVFCVNHSSAPIHIFMAHDLYFSLRLPDEHSTISIITCVPWPAATTSPCCNQLLVVNFNHIAFSSIYSQTIEVLEISSFLTCSHTPLWCIAYLHEKVHFFFIKTETQ